MCGQIQIFKLKALFKIKSSTNFLSKVKMIHRVLFAKKPKVADFFFGNLTIYFIILTRGYRMFELSDFNVFLVYYKR